MRDIANGRFAEKFPLPTPRQGQAAGTQQNFTQAAAIGTARNNLQAEGVRLAGTQQSFRNEDYPGSVVADSQYGSQGQNSYYDQGMTNRTPQGTNQQGQTPNQGQSPLQSEYLEGNSRQGGSVINQQGGGAGKNVNQTAPIQNKTQQGQGKNQPPNQNSFPSEYEMYDEDQYSQQASLTQQQGQPNKVATQNHMAPKINRKVINSREQLSQPQQSPMNSQTQQSPMISQPQSLYTRPEEVKTNGKPTQGFQKQPIPQNQSNSKFFLSIFSKSI